MQIKQDPDNFVAFLYGLWLAGQVEFDIRQPAHDQIAVRNFVVFLKEMAVDDQRFAFLQGQQVFFCSSFAQNDVDAAA